MQYLFSAMIIVMIVMIVAFFAIKSAGSIKPDAARELIKSGAVIIDVRSAGEYRDRHLPGVINIPGGALESEIARHAPDKGQVVLLHCLSGGRSGLATRQLKRLGYKQVYNLGSYARAEKIVAGAR